MLAVDKELHGKNDLQLGQWPHQLGAARPAEAKCRRLPQGKAAGHQAAAAPRRQLTDSAPTHPLVAGPMAAAASSGVAAAPRSVHTRYV